MTIAAGVTALPVDAWRSIRGVTRRPVDAPAVVVLPTPLPSTNYQGRYQTKVLGSGACRYTAACPSCGGDATWTTTPTGAGTCAGFALVNILCGCAT